MNLSVIDLVNNNLDCRSYVVNEKEMRVVICDVKRNSSVVGGVSNDEIDVKVVSENFVEEVYAVLHSVYLK